MKRRALKQGKTPCVQPMPEELVGSLLAFTEAKFYAGHGVAFAKDRRRLLEWVILWPAHWLEERGVTVGTGRYGEILRGILMEAAAHGRLEEVHYLPAWLARVVQSHFGMHGDEIYVEAKSMRNLVENALAVAGTRAAAGPDVARELAGMRRLLRAGRAGGTGAKKRGVKGQLTLL